MASSIFFRRMDPAHRAVVDHLRARFRTGTDSVAMSRLLDVALTEHEQVDTLRKELDEVRAMLSSYMNAVADVDDAMTAQAKAQDGINKYLKRTKHRVPVQLTIPA